MSSDFTTAPNPYAVTTLNLAPSLPDPSVASRRLRISVILLVVYLAISAGVACIEIESIVATGPVLFVCGIVMAVAMRKPTNRRFRFLAWSFLSFPILCFLLINLFSLGPREAQIPISTLCVLFAAAISMAALITLRRHSRGEPVSGPAESSESEPTSTIAS